MVLQLIQEFIPGWLSSYFLFFSFIVGAFRLGVFLFKLISPFFTRRLNLTKRYNGGWALVTGGSEGIGYAIAEELAKSGLDIILVSRSIQKLESAKAKLLKINSNIKVEIKSIDFEKLTTEEEYLSAFEDILKKDVSVLVNNVGYCITHKFSSLTFLELRQQMKINCLPMAILSRLFIEKMNSRKSRSGIINLSSASTMVSFTGCCHYSATKMFDDYLSQALEYEYKDKIDTLTVRPSYVTTEMTKNTDSFLHTSASKCGKSIVDSLGVRSVCYGPLSHNFQGLGSQNLYGGILSKIYSKSMADLSKIYDSL